MNSEWWRLNEWTMPRRWPLGEVYGDRKRDRTLHSPEEVARGRRHVSTRAWARERLKGILAEAETYARMADDLLWDLVPPTTVPRRHYVNQLRGCPVHGVAVKDFDTFHPWRLDVETHPWKLQCPVGGEWYPSNDFARGDLTSGPYPDDGWGCRVGDEHYYFIAEYAELVYLRHVCRAAVSLSEAYLWTGDPLFAHKAAIVLHRQAEEYRHLSECLDDRARCDCGYPRRLPRDPLVRPNGNGWVGMVTDRIWENGQVSAFAAAYDAIFDAIDGDRALFELMRRKGRDFPDGASCRAFFETHYLRVAAQALLDGAIYGNDGMHQGAMVRVAAVLDADRCRDLVDWVYFGAGQMRGHLANHFHRDGAAYESLGGYNRIHVEGFWEFSRLMERLRSRRPRLYPASRYPRVAADPKGRLLFDFPLRTVLIDRYSPQVGDTGGIPTTRRAPLRRVGDDASPGLYDLAYRLFEDPDYARALAEDSGEVPHPDLCEEEIDDRIREVLRGRGSAIRRITDLRDGYGLAVLRRGSGEDARALFLWYGACRGHSHDDLLDIGFCAKGLSLMQSLGYPRSWHFCEYWEKNWVTHYKVGIGGLKGWVKFKGREPSPPDGTKAVKLGYKGVARLIADLGPVQIAEACGEPYEETTDARRRFILPGSPRESHLDGGLVYARTCLLLDLSDRDACVLDLFRVRGGDEHVWSFHGPPGRMTTEGLNLTAQDGGTVAGPEVPYGAHVAEEAYRAFSYLDRVSRARPDGSWAATWELDEEQSTRLRVSMLSPGGTEVIAAKGRPVSGGTPYELDWVLARNAAAAEGRGCESQFLSVIEPYCGARVVRDIRNLKVEGPPNAPFPPVAVRIESPDMTHTVLATASPEEIHRVEGGILFRGDYGIVTERRGRLHSMTLVGATHLEAAGIRARMDRGWIEAGIEAVDRDRNELVADLPSGSVATGGFVSVVNDVRSSTYRVEEVREEGGRTILRLDGAPRIGEGVATGFGEGEVETSTLFPLAYLHGTGYRYYHGARMTDASGTREFRVADVRRPTPDSPFRVYLDPDRHPRAPAKELRRAFRVGKGETVFHLWDFGAGDRVRLPATAVVTFGEGAPRILAGLPVALSGTDPAQSS